MDLQVKIGFDEKAEELLEKLIDVMGKGIQITPTVTVEKTVESISDVEMAQPMEETEETVTSPVNNDSVDYSTLRKEAKSLGVQLVQMKKKDEVKALVAKYGYKKISDVSDENLTKFIQDLKAIKEM